MVLLLLAALLGQRALRGEDAYSCVTSATFCICESSDPRVSAAGMAVLDAALFIKGRCYSDATFTGGGGGNIGLGNVSVTVLKAASSSRVLSAVESLLQYRDESKSGTSGTDDAPRLDASNAIESSSAEYREAKAGASSAREEERLDGCGFGAPLRGMLDPSASLLARAMIVATAAAADKSGDGASATNPVQQKPASTASSLSNQRLWRLLCKQLERGGSGKLSPVGVVSTLRYAEGVLRAVTDSTAVGIIEYVLLGKRSGGAGNRNRNGGLIGIICKGILGRRHLQAVAEWPLGGGVVNDGGGGISGVAAVVTTAVAVLNVPLLTADVPYEALLSVQQAMHTHGLVASLLGSMRVLCQTEGGRPRGGCGREEKEREKEVADRIGTARVIRKNTAWDHNAEASLCACVDLLSRLVLLSPHFSLQFVEEGGLPDLVSAGALLNNSSAALATGALVIASQLARASADNYARLRDAGVDTSLGALLAHADPTVRAKACNLVGNLCRHSSFFYVALQERRCVPLGEIGVEEKGEETQKPFNADGVDNRGNAAGAFDNARVDGARQKWDRNNGDIDFVEEGFGGELLRHRGESSGHDRRKSPLRTTREATAKKSVVDHLVDLCTDSDPSARKLAFFAVGNAAFHSNALYACLAPAVAPLVAALNDPEEKTRANAAGALGNLVRNGGALSGDLSRMGGVTALLNLAARDPAAAPRRIALFSLGTCCAYAPCREALNILDSGGHDSRLTQNKMSPGSCGGRMMESQRRGNEGIGSRQKWDLNDCGNPISLPSTPGFELPLTPAAAVENFSPALELRLLELERAAEGGGDDVARKYVGRLRTKLSAPVQT